MLKRLVVSCALAALLPLTARAQGPIQSSYGFRAGFSSSPDQLVLGGQMSIGEVAPNLSFDPNVELGFGDNVTIIAFNLDMHYHFALYNSSWRPYLGAGAGINHIQFDLPPGFSDDSVTKVAGSFILGAGVPTRSGNRFFTELKVGLGDWASDFKVLVGWNFGR
ncbi:MAG: hypothetical protein ACRENJ_10375 [Candidatus Eiseniibacteriota bacterium]